MKTSLICLLLLAAVACAAPQAGEMPGAKRAGMAEKMAEKREEIAEKMRERAEENGEEMSEKRKEMAEKRKEMAEKMREKAEEKREESKNAVAAAKSDGEEESRYYPYCYGPCYGPYGEPGCFYDDCFYYYDVLFYEYPCVCCSDYNAPYCY